MFIFINLQHHYFPMKTFVLSFKSHPIILTNKDFSIQDLRSLSSTIVLFSLSVSCMFTTEKMTASAYNEQTKN